MSNRLRFAKVGVHLLVTLLTLVMVLVLYGERDAIRSSAQAPAWKVTPATLAPPTAPLARDRTAPNDHPRWSSFRINGQTVYIVPLACPANLHFADGVGQSGHPPAAWKSLTASKSVRQGVPSRIQQIASFP